MEAKFHHADPAPSDCITVTATKEEWRDVMDQLVMFRDPKRSGADLIHWLINQGVYE